MQTFDIGKVLLLLSKMYSGSVHTRCTGVMTHTLYTARAGALSVCPVFVGNLCSVLEKPQIRIRDRENNTISFNNRSHRTCRHGVGLNLGRNGGNPIFYHLS